MKRQRLDLGSGMSVEVGKDWNGLYFMAFAKGASWFCRDPKELRRSLRLPLKTPSREKLDAWLQELPTAPAEQPVAHTEVKGSFDPQAHDDDPTANTKMVL